MVPSGWQVNAEHNWPYTVYGNDIHTEVMRRPTAASKQKLSVSHSQDNGRLLAVSATYCACGQLMNHNDGDIRMK